MTKQNIIYSTIVSTLVGFSFLLIIQQAILATPIVALSLLLCPFIGAIITVLDENKSLKDFVRYILFSISLIVLMIFFSFLNGSEIPGITVCFSIFFSFFHGVGYIRFPYSKNICTFPLFFPVSGTIIFTL